MTINHRVLLGLAGLFMGLLGSAIAIQGVEHSSIIVAFQFVAAALLLYWAMF